MTSLIQNIVVIGAGHAGGTVCAQLRHFGFEGAITLVGDEALLPYQRPPLSKAWLKGEMTADHLVLKPREFYEDAQVTLRLEVHCVRLDRPTKSVLLSDGTTLAYDALILATGARAVMPPIPGIDLEGVMSLRTVMDADKLKAAIRPACRVAVLGGGYIGLEVAASSRALGAEAIVIEREDRILARVACSTLSDFFREYHSSKGVEFRLGCSAVGLDGAGRVSAVLLSDGSSVPCDVVVVGVGARPNDEIAAQAGLETDGGVVVDLDARTSDPEIYAIGDVAMRPMPIYERMFRMESVPNALEQSKQAAAAICGRPRPAGECPWQWSDQFDLKLQIAGYPFDAERFVVRGDPATAKFAIFHLHGDRVQAVEAINAPAEFMVGKQLILNRNPIDQMKLADRNVSMKEVSI